MDFEVGPKATQQLITKCRGQAGKGEKDKAWHWERVGGNHLRRAKAHDCRGIGVHYPFEYPGLLVAHYPHCHGGAGEAESNVEVPVGRGGEHDNCMRGGNCQVFCVPKG